MIEWATPWALLLLIPVALLPLQGRLTGRNELAVPAEGAVRRRWSLRLLLWWVPELLRVVGLALAVIALARPQIVHTDATLEEEGLDILLAVDTSGSMRMRDYTVGGVPTSRLAVAKGVLAEFVEARPHDRVGVVVFGEEAFTFVPLTLDHATLSDSLDYLQIGIAGAGKTAVGAAVAVAARRMKQVESKERLIILLTDGRNNVVKPDPRQAAQAAAALGMRIYTVGIGAPEELDISLLAGLAEITGGQYYHADSTRDLFAIYETIDRLETSPAEVRELIEEEQLFRTWLAPAFLLLGLQALLVSTWLRRGP